jgi:hypothetical protein
MPQPNFVPVMPSHVAQDPEQRRVTVDATRLLIAGRCSTIPFS